MTRACGERPDRSASARRRTRRTSSEGRHGPSRTGPPLRQASAPGTRRRAARRHPAPPDRFDRPVPARPPRMDGRGRLSSDARRPRPCPGIWAGTTARVHGSCVPHGASPHRTTVRCTTSPDRRLARTPPTEIHLPAPRGVPARGQGCVVRDRRGARKGPPWHLSPRFPVSGGPFGDDAGQRGLSRHHPGDRPRSQGPGTGTRGAWHHAESEDPPGHGPRPETRRRTPRCDRGNARDAGDVPRATLRNGYGRTASIRSRIRRLTPSTGTRSWVIVSRSRMVTAPSSSESTSTVTHHGVPISSWRR